MPNAHPALQTGDTLRVKDITDHAIRLDLVETSVRPASHDAGGILTTDYSAYDLQIRHEICIPVLK